LHFQKIEVFGTKFFKVLPSLGVANLQSFPEIVHEVFQVHDPNSRSKWLDRTRSDSSLFTPQICVCLWEKEDSNVTSRFVQMPDISRNLVML